ncbi:MAG: hypothetical protein QRY72_01030 [Candidatus Rhabdochlamydia sp.]
MQSLNALLSPPISLKKIPRCPLVIIFLTEYEKQDMDNHVRLHPAHLACFCRTRTQIHHCIVMLEHRLVLKPLITHQKYTLFLKKLNRASSLLTSLEHAFYQKKQPPTEDLKLLRDQIITLYALIDSAYLKNLLHQLHLSSLRLKKTLRRGEDNMIIENMQVVQEQMHTILSLFLPSFKERRVLVIAKLIIEQAEYFLLSHQQTPLFISEKIFEDAEMILEEVADYLSENNPKAVRKLMQSVSLTQKKIILAYLEPKDLLTHILHDVERAAHQNVRFAS